MVGGRSYTFLILIFLIKANIFQVINFKMPTLSTDLNKKMVSFFCVLIFMKITSFMLKRVEHEISL